MKQHSPKKATATSKKSKRVPSSPNPSTTNTTPNSTIPDGWEHVEIISVHQPPPSNQKGDPAATRSTTNQQQRRGMWTQRMSHLSESMEVWIFPTNDVPPGVEKTKQPQGVWGKDHHQDVLCIVPPNTKPPSTFQPLGTWVFPVCKRNTSSLSPNEQGFLTIGPKVVKEEKLDVAGDWKLLYLQDGQEKEKKKKKKKIPKQEKKPIVMHITVETPKGDQLVLEVQPTDTIDQVKDQIHAHPKGGGIPKDEQRLQDPHGNFLKDNAKTLEEYKIQNDDVLKLDPMQIRIQDPSKPKGVEYYTLTVDPFDTIRMVKQQLQDQQNIPVEHQRLIFPKAEGALCKDSQTLYEQGIRHQDVLQLVPMRIHVRQPQAPQGNKSSKNNTTLLTLSKSISPTTTIDQVQTLLDRLHGIPVADQRLRFRNQSLIESPSSKTLDDWGIRHDDVLDLDPMQIIIKDWKGKSFPPLTILSSPQETTIESVQDQIQDLHDIPKAIQYLIFQGTLLEPDKTLEDYQIRHLNIVNLDRMKIYIKDWKGKTFTLDVDPTDTIDEIKERIHNREGLAPDEQVLKFQTKLLDDPTKTLQDYSIGYKDTIDLSKAEPSTYTIQLTPWNDPLSTGYKTPTGKIQREGIRASSKEQLKHRWHTDLESEVKEMAIKARKSPKKKTTTSTQEPKPKG